MREGDLQGGNRPKKKTRNEQGGFMALLHNVERETYGPSSPLDAKTKIFLYLRHRALRDWTQRKQIGKAEIMESTGLEKRHVERCLAELEKQKMIQVTRTKVGKVWSDNIYELHPDRFGKDYIYRPENPSFGVIYGGKAHTSNPDRPGSLQEVVPPDTPVGVPTNEPVGVPPDTPVGNALNYTESLENSAPKNPLKNPYKELFPKQWNSSGEMTQAEIDKRREFLNKQLEAIVQTELERRES